MLIDCHGHFTREPENFHRFRDHLISAALKGGPAPQPYPGIPDEHLIQIITDQQLRLQRERGTDLTVLSPRASGMSHHIPDQQFASEWARHSNDIIEQIIRLFPQNFAGACQLPQVTGGDIGPVIEELQRCAEAGFVACNLNPDPSGGSWNGPLITDPWWDPLFTALEQLTMPAMIHASASTRSAVHTTGAHYLSTDTIVFMQLIGSDLFRRHPRLKLVIPHGGGAVALHWGRYRGLALKIAGEGAFEQVLEHVFFDTCVYQQEGIQLLFDVVGAQNLLFGSELLGAVSETDPRTGHAFDDTRHYIEALDISAKQRHAVYEGNIRRVYPRLDELLTAQGRSQIPAEGVSE